MKTLLIHSAIHWEAEALIKYYGLKKNLNFKGLEVFSNSEITYLVSGIGKLKAACAISRVLQTFENPEQLAFLNLGVAGCKANHYQLGTLLRINACTDIASSRSYYPDLTLNLDLPEASIETHDQAVSGKNQDRHNSSLVDMELAGAFEAAASFITWDKIFSFKIVSDFLKVGCLNKEFVNSLIEQNLDTLITSIEKIKTYLDLNPKLLNSESVNLINKVAEQIKLTSSQKLKLEAAVKGAEVNKIEWRNVLNPYLGCEPQSKQEVTIMLDEVCRAISVS